ncbi:MAG TPA: hypothetical protein VGG10_20045 [Rhizomicrobium sp.]|jgi:hypothetical protein
MPAKKSQRRVKPEPPPEKKERWTATDLFGLVDCVIEDVASSKCVWRSLPDAELCISYWELPDGRLARVVFAVVDPMAGDFEGALYNLSEGPMGHDDHHGTAPLNAAANLVLLKRRAICSP